MRNFKPSTNPCDYVFTACVGEGWEGDDSVVVAITPEAYLEETGYMYDQHLPINIPDNLFEIMQEGAYEFIGTPKTVENARIHCRALGMKESSKLEKLVNP
jgi:hypothetical protein